MRALLLLLCVLLSGFALGQADRPPVSETGVGASSRAYSVEELKRIEEAVRKAPNAQMAASAIPRDLFSTPALRQDLREMGRGNEKARQRAIAILGAFQLPAATVADASALAKVREIKSGAEYRTSKPGTASNWFGRLLEGFGRWLETSMNRWLGRGSGMNAPDMPDISLPGWLIYIVWALLAGVILLAAWPLVRLIRFRIARRERREKGLLEEEPERTRSEYLNLADELAAKGDFRGAIRMSYLAALKRFDEARVARFDRGETNWEHLARIRSSPTLPEGLDFRPATAAFDHYWYGKRVALRADYERFVAWYDEVDAALRKGAGMAA